MLKKFRKKLLIPGLAALFFCLMASGAWAKTYTNLLVFGDSLSDDGKTSGRKFTNDDVWVDYLAVEMGNPTIENKAISGDTSVQLKKAVEDYTASNPINGENTLVAIWIGGNDINDGLEAILVGTNLDEVLNIILPARIDNNIVPAIQELINKGARNFLILNVPDLGKTPLVRETAERYGVPALPTIATLMTNAFNTLLLSTIKPDAFTGATATFIPYDANKYMTDIIAADRALVDLDKRVFKYLPPEDYYKEVGALSTDVNDYIFWDNLHPTSKAHEMLAVNLYDTTPALQIDAVDSSTDSSCFIDSTLASSQNNLVIFLGLMSGLGLLLLVIRKSRNKK